MGLNLSWVAVEGSSRADILDWLGFEEAGEVSSEIGAEFTCSTLPTGWVVVVANEHDFALDDALRMVSSSGSMSLGGQILESENFNEVRAYRAGRLNWAVAYEPERDRNGVRIEGSPPPELPEILSRRDAEALLAVGQPSGHLFDAPSDLAAVICGYRAGQTASLEWFALRRKSPKGGKTGPKPQSLSAAMRSDLLPLLRSLGWKWSAGRPSLADSNHIVRHTGTLKQSIWFDFAAAQETYIVVYFSAERISAEAGFWITGHVIQPRPRLTLRERFTWRRFGELTRPQPPPENLIGAVIARARRDILVADRFLQDWEHNAAIYIDQGPRGQPWPASQP